MLSEVMEESSQCLLATMFLCINKLIIITCLLLIVSKKFIFIISNKFGSWNHLSNLVPIPDTVILLVQPHLNSHTSTNGVLVTPSYVN